uniref:Integrase catalytic domain-containing protein n=1 Tax=Vitis vinifera TaxID=29760 RepID=A5API6_VITVI|nr:hypothetical protein VITISV_025970 [Vitis vinifera]
MDKATLGPWMPVSFGLVPGQHRLSSHVCSLVTAIALGYASSDFGPSTQIVCAYDSTRMEVMGTLEIELLIGLATFVVVFQVLRIPTSFNLLLGRPWIHRVGAIPYSLHQKVKFIHDGQVVVVQSMGDVFISAEPVLQISHSDDDFFLTGFTFDEVHTLEIEDFCRDFVAMSFDQHSSTVVLDMMRGMSYLPDMGLGRRQHGPSEFMAFPDHDVAFGLGFIPTEVDYRYMERLPKERDEIDDHGTFVESGDIVDKVVPHDEYVNEMLAMSLSQIKEIAPFELASPFDLFRVSVLEIVEEIQVALVLEIAEDVIVVDGLFDGPIGLVERVSDFVDPPLSFDVLLGFVSRHDDIFDIDDEIAQHDSDDDSSFVSDSDPIDHRVSPVVGDTKIVDFGTADQPRELRIGSDLSVDERDSLIQLLIAYLDVFAWSYEDMLDLDPSIIQHRLPLLPHARPVKQKLRRLHPRWSLQCQHAFERIREYLLSPPVLAPPTPGRPLLLCLSVSDVALGCMLAQLDDSGKDRAICYLNPLRYLFDKPALVGRLMKWLVLPTEFDIHYVAQKSIKGSIVANHLASLLVSDGRAINDDFPDENVAVVTSLSSWRMYFDGATNHSGYGIGVLLISPHGDHIPRSIQGEWKTRNAKLRPYHAYLELLVGRFDDLIYTHLPRPQNQFANALAAPTSMIDIPTDATVRPLLIESRSAPAYCCLIDDTEIDDGLPCGHEFILVAIDYFTKWVEAASYGRLTSSRVASFIRSHIICRYGVPHELISDRRVHFMIEVDTLVRQYGIRHHGSSAYKPQKNGAVEAVNKNIKRILRRMIKTSQDWSHTLLFGIRYGGSATSRDRDGFTKGSIRAADSRGRLGSGSI